MATDFELLMHRDADAWQIDEAVRALDWLEAIEADLTIYNPSSPISLVNRAAGGEPVRVSATVFEVLRRAKQLSEALEGAFDVTSGSLVEVWGFTSRSGKRPTEDRIAEAVSLVGWKEMRLDEELQTVRLPRSGMQINLGAIGKGYALDCVAARLTTAGIENFLLHGGNSSILARGHADRSAGGGWLVGLMHPIRIGMRLGGIRLIDQALATSGSGKRFFHFQGKRYGHVIDPRTGMPTGDSLSVTALAPDATSADAVSTGLYVLGLDKMEQFTTTNPEYHIVATVAGERQSDVQLRTFNYDGLLHSD